MPDGYHKQNTGTHDRVFETKSIDIQVFTKIAVCKSMPWSRYISNEADASKGAQKPFMPMISRTSRRVAEARSRALSAPCRTTLRR